MIDWLLHEVQVLEWILRNNIIPMLIWIVSIALIIKKWRWMKKVKRGEVGFKERKWLGVKWGYVNYYGEWIAFWMITIFIASHWMGYQITVVHGGSMLPTTPEEKGLVIIKTSAYQSVWDRFVGHKEFKAYPQRGDIVSARMFYPDEKQTKMVVKRVMGTEGDRVEFRKNGYWINGVHLIAENQEATAEERANFFSSPKSIYSRPFRARGLDGKTWWVSWMPETHPMINEPYFHAALVDAVYEDLVLPENTVYLGGDNWVESSDSRLAGPVGIDQIEGRVIFLIDLNTWRVMSYE